MSEPRPAPHAALDPATRRDKARKIEALLPLEADGEVLRLLEVGTGSGAIAHHFAQAPGREVHAVDILDQRTVREGYRFTLVSGARLPFPDAHFDAVISNHVIEHVGGLDEQALHLREIARVLRPGGSAWLATPNRWQIVEPHFRLAFLSWWPPALRTPWLRLWRRGRNYDCFPRGRRELERLVAAAGLAGENQVLSALRHMARGDASAPRSARIIARLPDSLLRPLLWLSPTHVYLLRRA